MKVIGITGGIGSGKSELLSYIKEHYLCEIVRADDIAKELQEPGAACYAPLLALLGKDIAGEDGRVNRAAVAEKIFGDRKLLEKVNDLVHPAVIAEILRRIKKAEENEKIPLFFVEAALLIESRFGKICNEIWYIYADEDVRRERLRSLRGYSEEKITAVMKSQLPDQVFWENCQTVINNSRSLSESIAQIEHALENYRWQK